MSETRPCNIAAGTEGCKTLEPAMDCKLGIWADWGTCRGTCGRGQRERRRSIVEESKNGGSPCVDHLSETAGCDLAACAAHPGTDCKWDAWSQWGACDKCGGQRKRFRHIAQMAKDGGEACDPGASDETARCD